MAAAVGQVEHVGCCSCLPYLCRWGSGAAAGEKNRRRRRRFRLRLSWFSWPWWLGRRNGKKKKKKTTAKEWKRKGKKLLLLLFASSQAKKALASVSSGSSSILHKVSSFAVDGKRQSRSRLPWQTTAVAGDGAASSSSTKETVPARPETSTSTTSSGQPSPRRAGGAWRSSPARRRSFRPADRGGAAGGRLWTMATTLGVIVFFGRVTAVVFLCSCLYGTRFVRAQAAGSKAKARSGGGGGERFDELCTEEQKKKVVMEGLLDRAGKRQSSRFCK